MGLLSDINIFSLTAYTSTTLKNKRASKSFSTKPHNPPLLYFFLFLHLPPLFSICYNKRLYFQGFSFVYHMKSVDCCILLADGLGFRTDVKRRFLKRVRDQRVTSQGHKKIDATVQTSARFLLFTRTFFTFAIADDMTKR